MSDHDDVALIPKGPDISKKKATVAGSSRRSMVAVNSSTSKMSLLLIVLTTLKRSASVTEPQGRWISELCAFMDR